MKSEKKKKVLWTVGLGTLASFLGSVIWVLLSSEPFLISIKSVPSQILNFLYELLSFGVPIWTIILLVLLALFTVALINYTSQEASQDLSKDTLHDFLNYTELRAPNWLWKWKYELVNNRWEITNLSPHCPKCEQSLIRSQEGDMVHCLNCGFEWEAFIGSWDDQRYIHTVIIQNVKSGNFHSDIRPKGPSPGGLRRLNL